MTQTLVSVALFVLLLALVPVAIKWLQARSAGAGSAVGVGSRVVCAVAVGPHQRVVTVEVGPHDARTWLILGVTPQSISCLHHIAPRADLQRYDTEGSTAPAVHCAAAPG